MKTLLIAASILALGTLTATAQDKSSPQPGTVAHQCWDVSASSIRDKDAQPAEPSTVGSTAGSTKSADSKAQSGSSQGSTTAPPPIATRTRPSGMPAC